MNSVFLLDKLHILNFFISLFTMIFVLSIYILHYIPDNWTTIISYLSFFLFCFQVYSLKKTRHRIWSFECWFLFLSYLFMFGQVLLSGLFDIQYIEALGFHRPVIDQRYSEWSMFISSAFILASIQAINNGFILIKPISIITIENRYKDYILAKILLFIGFPCHLLYSTSMISYAQRGGSYNDIVDQSGLIDDFSNFFIYGMIALIFSKKLNRKAITIVILAVLSYFLIIMSLTGDRRYQIVSIIVIFLGYLHCYSTYNILTLFKYILYSYPVLVLLYLLREIRENSLLSFFDFVPLYYNALFELGGNIFTQTLYEFGGSFYTVCLAFTYIPLYIGYEYGLTIIVGLFKIFPFGFAYQDLDFYKEGYISVKLMNLGSTTVGASIYADLYANFGIFCGLLISLIVGIVIGKLINKSFMDKSYCYNMTRYFIIFYSLIHLVRASFTEVIRNVVWGLAILFFIEFILKRYSNGDPKK